jgi:hypothetical protein
LIKKNLKLLLIFQLCVYSLFCQAGAEADVQRHPLYVGVTGGYGSTTWTGLVPVDLLSPDDQTFALKLSMPIRVDEGGGVWGFFAGYEFIPAFALEASFTRYQDATIRFDKDSNFNYYHHGLTEFVTQTETVSLMGKFMVMVPRTKIKIYSSVGGAALHRKDMLKDGWLYTPTFGVGFNTDFSPHIMGELGANFTAGYGEVQLNPTDVYFPFLYSVFARLAYRF